MHAWLIELIAACLQLGIRLTARSWMTFAAILCLGVGLFCSSIPFILVSVALFYFSNRDQSE